MGSGNAEIAKAPPHNLRLFNNHYQGAAFESARLFSETLDRTTVNRNAEIARPNVHTQQAELFWGDELGYAQS
jgi:hypothetical protein